MKTNLDSIAGMSDAELVQRYAALIRCAPKRMRNLHDGHLFDTLYFELDSRFISVYFAQFGHLIYVERD